MPLYFGHKNTKGLAVSPALQSLHIDLLRAPPSAVNVIARPTVTQPGYSSYINHLPAFLKATNEKKTIPLTSKGYTTAYPVNECINISHPSLVIDYNGPPPSKVVEDFSNIGFERIRMHKNDNILRFPAVSLDQVRTIKQTTPNRKTPSPANTVNLDAFDTWVMVLRIVSNLLSTHVYPAFKDGEHFMEEIEMIVSDISLKRMGDPIVESVPKRQRMENENRMVDEGEEQDEDDDETEHVLPSEPILSRAKPTIAYELPWGQADEIPNANGLFFPYIPELQSYDDSTIPRLFEDYLLQSLGNTPEQQLDRFAQIRSAWGIISKTDSGSIMAHLGKVILLSLTSQTRTFPIIQDGVYQGCILSGGRFFVGLNGVIHRPLTFPQLQEETGKYHLHSRVLQQIAEIVSGDDSVDDDDDAQKILTSSSLREMRSILMDVVLTESNRDEIRKLAVHLRFKGDNQLAVNPQTIVRVLNAMSTHEETDDFTLPMHHSALFSRDKVFVSLSAFGFQAPSFTLDNCPRVNLKDSKPPTTLVMRQKALDVATLDWKRMIETKEIKNNPRNLSKANRDRTIISNDKTLVWGKLKEMCGAMATEVVTDDNGPGFSIDTNDGLDVW